ncbi:hypothetical protein P7C71_g4137, partial [Lecanoromycetidae sp. Uapishka_2]
MASPGFGFSVGDTIAGLEVAVNVYKACKEIDGASDQFQRVVVELQIYIAILRRLQDTQYSTISDIQRLAQVCEAQVQTFLAKISKYEAGFAKESSSSRSLKNAVTSVKGFPRKAQWAIVAHKEVEKLKNGLDTSFTALAILLNLDLRSVNGTSARLICSIV